MLMGKRLGLVGLAILAVAGAVVAIVLVQRRAAPRKPDFDAMRCAALRFPDVRLLLCATAYGYRGSSAASVTVDSRTGALVKITLYESWVAKKGEQPLWIRLEHVGRDQDADRWKFASAPGLEASGAKPGLHQGEIVAYAGCRMLLYDDGERRAYLVPAREVENGGPCTASPEAPRAALANLCLDR